MPQVDQLLLTTKSYKYSLCVKYLSATMRYVAEILILILLTITSYASLQKGVLKIQLQPPPTSLLGSNSTVSDYYGGDIASPFTKVMNSDVSLVMYYAPWDLDSQLAVLDFEKIALKYENQVFCSSINCWVHNGACKKTFPKLRNFPLILGYVGGAKGIQYRGPLQYEFLDKFVQSLLRPITRVETASDLYKLMAYSTAVVTGYFNFSLLKPNGFYSFYLASLRNLEYDIQNSVTFAAVTNPSAAKRIGIHLPSSSAQPFDIRLHLWNETLIYPATGKNFDVNRLLQWIHYRSHSPIQFIWPSGRKNQIIQHYLIDQQRPSLILFTPDLKSSVKAMMMKELALEYSNCAFSPRITLLSREIEHHRVAIETSSLKLEKKCSIFEREKLCSINDTAACIFFSPTDVSGMELCSSISKSKQLFQFQGLSCRTNRSLNFYVMDSNHYPNYLTKLGYSLRQNQLNLSVAFIIDPKTESLYVMEKPVTKSSLRELIVRYTENSLARFWRSYNKPKPCPSGRICVQEISAKEFESVVLDPSHDAIVFYKKSGCVFCEVGARTFLKLSQMFTRSDSLLSDTPDTADIRFVTIDSEKNDLPWQYTVDKYPSIIFYPANRKSESRIFPHDIEFNEISLLNFTVSQLSLKKRITWFIDSCQETSCLQEAQRQIGIQVVNIEKQIRSVRQRLLWADVDDQTSLLQLIRHLLKERYFFRELGHSVRRTVVDLLRHKQKDRYPDGVRLAAV